MTTIQIIIIWTASLFGGLLLASPTPAMPLLPTVDLGYSQYRGMSLSNGVDQYLGIRYAKAPLGDLRFRGPEDPEETAEILDASSVILLVIVGLGH
jgi:acetylcholinesterase